MTATPPSFDFDLDRLLAPIQPGDPAGASLRYDPVYDHIRSLRREDDASLPQGVWKSELKRADWPALEIACLEILETRSKDWQVAAWLLEAWVHLRGFAGVMQGFRVMHSLAEAFWDDLHPRISDGDVEFRLAPVLWLNNKLPQQLKLLPLTAPESHDLPVCTLELWEKASQRAHLRPGSDGVQPGGTLLAELEQGALLTPTERLMAKSAEVRAMLVSCTALDALVDEKLGKEAPGLMPIRAVAEQALGVLQFLLRDRVPTEFGPRVQPNHPAPYFSTGEDEIIYGFGAGPIRNRAHAYQMLADAAEYLARTEPHSPTPYLVRRAVSWGAMPLDTVLSELVRNQTELSEIYRLLDISQQVLKK